MTQISLDYAKLQEAERAARAQEELKAASIALENSKLALQQAKTDAEIQQIMANTALTQEKVDSENLSQGDLGSIVGDMMNRYDYNYDDPGADFIYDLFTGNWQPILEDAGTGVTQVLDTTARALAWVFDTILSPFKLSS